MSDSAPISRADTELIEQLKPAFVGKYVCGVSNVTQEEAGGLRFTLADAQVSHTVGTGDNERTEWSMVTVAHYGSASHRFPGFGLQPSHAILEMALRMAGAKNFDIDFPSHPAFSTAYILTGTYPANTRRLFDHGPLLDELGRRPGLSMGSNLSSLVLYRWAQQFEPAQRKAFALEAAAVFARFEEAASAADAKPAPKQDPRAVVESLPGVGNELLKSLVTRADLAAFLRQPPPRAVPVNIRAAGSNETAMLFIIMGLVVALVASVFVAFNVYPALSAGKPLMGSQTLYAVLASAFAAFGIGVAIYGIRAGLRAQGLLRTGTLASASLEAIDPTGVRVNDVEEYRLQMRYRADAQQVQAECRIRGTAVKRARQLKAEGKNAPILHDAADPQRVFYAESLLTLDPEIEP